MNKSSNDNKIAVRNLIKIFGPEPERALDLLKQGRDKEEILRETGLTVGVNDISFSASTGEIFVVMGLSGSGKSTLVRMLNRLIMPTSGEVLIDGEDIVGADDETLRRIRLEKIAMVFQHFALFPHKSVAENVEYGLKVRRLPARERRERAMTALEQVGLAAWADRRPDALSGGMQQRVGLARGLAVDPEILLMDEPFSALDPLIRREMQDELLQLQRSMQKTIIFITHDLHEALTLGDQIAIMKEGRFVQLGTAAEIVGEPADEYVSSFTQDVDRSRVFGVDTVIDDAHELDIRKETVQSALSRMDELGRNALLVVENGDPAGMVTYRDLSNADGKKLDDAMISEFPQTTTDASLHQIFDECAQGLPVVVLDGKGNVAGVVNPEEVFRRIAGENEQEERA